MGTVSPYFMGKIFGWVKGSAMPAPPTTYVALYNGDPLGGGNATEQTTAINTGGRLAAGFGDPTNGVIANAAKIDFGKSAGNATVTYAALLDAATGGNILMSQALSNPRTIYQNDPVYYDIGQLQFGIVAAS